MLGVQVVVDIVLVAVSSFTSLMSSRPKGVALTHCTFVTGLVEGKGKKLLLLDPCNVLGYSVLELLLPKKSKERSEAKSK